ncbi:hypothetical protein E2562_020109 [Oryza meyeriana var. granulata]|uniref:Uncharacterized protein n=1 Tax=Oryza meyeriana var. granulata TaxID=110450 RepID=A0A6G1E9M2_9ORYZ|nr:hypothetical protein E2562_020109 [Oryza meyeriana var. granulata]
MKSLADSAASPATKITIPSSVAGEAALPFGKSRYKVWAFAAIALLALWSMSAASVSLRWSSGRFLLATSASEDLDAPLHDDLDSLEMEEREKLVGRMWDMYTRTGDEVRLPRFWQEAFEAAYEELAGDDMQVRGAAITEIARMSAHRLELEHPVNEEENTANIKSNQHVVVKS